MLEPAVPRAASHPINVRRIADERSRPTLRWKPFQRRLYSRQHGRIRAVSSDSDSSMVCRPSASSASSDCGFSMGTCPLRACHGNLKLRSIRHVVQLAAAFPAAHHRAGGVIEHAVHVEQQPPRLDRYRLDRQRLLAVFAASRSSRTPRHHKRRAPSSACVTGHGSSSRCRPSAAAPSRLRAAAATSPPHFFGHSFWIVEVELHPVQRLLAQHRHAREDRIARLQRPGSRNCRRSSRRRQCAGRCARTGARHTPPAGRPPARPASCFPRPSHSPAAANSAGRRAPAGGAGMPMPPDSSPPIRISRPASGRTHTSTRCRAHAASVRTGRRCGRSS